MKKLLFLLGIVLCSCTRTSTTITTETVPTDSLGTDSVTVTKTITTVESDPMQDAVKGVDAVSWFVIALGIFNACSEL